jgi:hypothetical protein
MTGNPAKETVVLFLVLCASFLVAPSTAAAQPNPSESESAKAAPLVPENQAEPASGAYPPAIEDNSFLIEEAYNQEKGIVQHISTLTYFPRPVHSFGYGFTQEWPVGGQQHQFSYTLPYTFQGGGLGNGIGDVMLNYRYQLLGHDDWAAISPRLSLIMASGDEEKGLGTGSNGLQFNLPVSKRVSPHWVFHLNAGTTFLHGVSSVTDQGIPLKRNLWSYNVGASAIALMTPNFNLMFETVSLLSNQFDEHGQVNLNKETIINPGLRYAINLGSLQIVPGFAIPVSFSGIGTRVGAFVYLSFEQPIKKTIRIR